MADNISLPGTGLDVATDKVSSVHYQIIKIALGSDGSATLLPGDGTNGIDVDVTRLPVDGTTGANAKVILRGYDPTTEAYVDLNLSTDFGNPAVPVYIISNPTVNSYGWDTSGSVVESDSGEQKTVKRAVISAASSGNNTIVAAVTDKKIRVLSVTLSASAAVNAKFQSGASGTDITGLHYFAANGGMVLPDNKHGWFETEASALLNLNLSGAVAVGGCITYIEV